MSVTRTLSAPSAFKDCASRMPIGPQPKTTVFAPLRSGKRFAAWTVTARGSIIAPSLKVIPSGRGVTLEASTAKYSLAVPVVWKPMTFKCSQRLYFPCRQG